MLIKRHNTYTFIPVDFEILEPWVSGAHRLIIIIRELQKLATKRLTAISLDKSLSLGTTYSTKKYCQPFQYFTFATMQ